MDTNTAISTPPKGISGSTLKIIALTTMLISHIASSVLDTTLIARGMYDLDMRNANALNEFIANNALIYYSSTIMKYIGRLSFPIFCFLLIEGFLHTRNHWKYVMRIAIFALISEIPFDLLITGKPFYIGAQNVFFTLLIGIFVMIGFKFISQKSKSKIWLPVLAVVGAIGIGYTSSFSYFGVSYILNKLLFSFGINVKIPIRSMPLAIVFSLLALIVYVIMCKLKSIHSASVLFADITILIAGMMLATSIYTEYAAFGILTIAVMYALRKSHFKSLLGGCIVLTLMSFSEITAFFAVILAYLYNGQRGIKMKYVFYVFYPLHLIVLYLICYFMNII
jgi:hypothetical protein